MNRLTVKPRYQPGEEGNRVGRYPDSAYDYEPGSIPATYQEMADQLPALFVSPAAADRARAHVYLRILRASVPPGTWVAAEAADSPNLQRSSFVTEPSLDRRTWSAHETRAEAEAHAAHLQAASDRDVDAHPWWGPNSRRKFGVELVTDGDWVDASYLRMPGASPESWSVFR